MPPDKRVHAGAAAVIVRDGKLLMIQRAGADGDGKWSIPGGWIDAEDVDAESTAVRETREETRVWVDPVAAAGHTLHTIKPPSGLAGEKALTVVVVCKWLHGEGVVAETKKCKAVEWVPVEEVEDRALFEPLRMWWATNGRFVILEAHSG